MPRVNSDPNATEASRRATLTLWITMPVLTLFLGCVNPALEPTSTPEDQSRRVADAKILETDVPRRLAPPIARKIPKTDDLHGDRRVDNYYWLRDKDSPEVVAYLQAENAYADAVLKRTVPLQEELYQEILGRIKQTDLSVPYREGEYFYYTRTEEGKQYRIHCRKRKSLEAPEEIILDLNELAKGETFLGVGAFEVSPDGNSLAYSTDTTGFREYTLFVKNLRTERLGPERIEKVKSVAWAADNTTMFYTVDDPTKRPFRLYRHRLGNTHDELLYEESDERFRVSVWSARSKGYIFAGSSSHTSSEIRYLDSHEADGEFRIIAPRRKDHEYSVDHHGDAFYILTNDHGRNFRLVKAMTESPDEASWQEIIPHSEKVMREQLYAFERHLVLREREGGLPQLTIVQLPSGESHRMSFPEAVYSVRPDQNPEFATETFRFSYQSLTTPNSIFDYNVISRDRDLLKKTEVLGDYDPGNYTAKRLNAEASDGTRIPISIVHRRGLGDGPHPTLLVGYGSYGFPYPVTFSHARVSLLDRGVVFAIAHIRGGGEMGKRWHDEGKMFNKKNTFTDFIAAAEELVDQKYTSPAQLAIDGGSAGGLLMGAVTNLRPDLFAAVIADVPFVDVLNTMLDSSVPLTVGEFEEWGNPQIKAEYEYIKSYCPYTNIESKAYPSVLVKTSYNDSQVMYWEPAKYVAKLRAKKTDQNPLLFRTNMGGGHGGSSGRYDRIQETALDYAFVLWQLGLLAEGP